MAAPRSPSHPRPGRGAPQRPARTRLPAWAMVCFFASGAAGLLYEVVWAKQLGYLLGNSLHAAATVVAGFQWGRVGSGLARLYAVNTFGAVAGAIAAGFVLLPTLGLTRSAWVAAATNAGVALLAWRAGRADSAREPDAPREASTPAA